ncbi:uncharacterized protein LOC127288898 [Leptopilina boulardi]|uniref:uncharacterized protein LOC127288898 n=1 Tax=Leptopilina boulardi TaxID=63433 RepID=UPI0021F5FB03|nr:uncharacterized protein LOC127288898 [Leptopilina boulardi]XP_051172563.1 uncharacterized protein LOC127288898 [Leptopilina boulardi]
MPKRRLKSPSGPSPKRKMWRSGCGARRGWSGRHLVAKKALPEFSPPAVGSRLDRVETLVQRVFEERGITPTQPEEIAEPSVLGDNSVARLSGELNEAAAVEVAAETSVEASTDKIVATGAVKKVLRQRRDPYQLERAPGESEEAWESRLAVADLERTVAPVELSPERRVERLRLRQEFEVEYRNRHPLKSENYVSGVPRPVYKPTASHLPKEAGVAEVCAIQTLPAPASSVISASGRRQLPAVLAGIMFKGLDPILTDPRLDPPMRSCFNCWKRGHRLSDCPKEWADFCKNCGRREVTLNTCPRCSRVHAEFLSQRDGTSSSRPSQRLVEREDPPPRNRRSSPVPQQVERPPPREENVEPEARVVAASGPTLLDKLRELDQRLEGVPQELKEELKLEFLKERRSRRH